jgi:hypothetical protein
VERTDVLTLARRGRVGPRVQDEDAAGRECAQALDARQPPAERWNDAKPQGSTITLSLLRLKESFRMECVDEACFDCPRHGRALPQKLGCATSLWATIVSARNGSRYGIVVRAGRIPYRFAVSASQLLYRPNPAPRIS